MKVHEYNARLRQRLDAALWPLFTLDATKIYRWRIQLECDCIIEVMTRGKDNLPHLRRWPDPLTRAPLAPGQLCCVHDGTPRAPYRHIEAWGDRREITHDADPLECPAWATPDVWEIIRHDEPHTSAFWKVTLSCGHTTEVCASPDWKPDDGPRIVSKQRRDEMAAEFADYWRENPDPDDDDERERGHYQRMLDQHWPTPIPERDCFTCRHIKSIVAYQRTGRLTPPPKPRDPVPPNRDKIEARLRKAEATAERLRKELRQLPVDPT